MQYIIDKTKDSSFLGQNYVQNPNFLKFVFRFRALARLDNKYDETMMDYYVAFIAMCKRASGLELTEEEGRRYLDTYFLSRGAGTSALSGTIIEL